VFLGLPRILVSYSCSNARLSDKALARMQAIATSAIAAINVIAIIVITRVIFKLLICLLEIGESSLVFKSCVAASAKRDGWFVCV
jgi:hypothetical protein